MALVQASAAAARSDWAKLPPAQRMVNSCMLAVAVFVMAFYAIAGLVFGYLHFFVLEGFVLVGGLPALGVALGSGALALGWSSHLWQRHSSSASANRCEGLRWSAYVVWALAWVMALVVGLASSAPPSAWGMAPNAEWMLAPLPWLWRFFLGFASDRVVLRLVLIGIGALLVGVMFAKLKVWPRGAFLGMGIAVCMLGAFLLGDASYQYAAARKLGGLAANELVQGLVTKPGAYNAWTFLCWWTGWATVALGSLLCAGGLFFPLEAFKRLQ